MNTWEDGAPIYRQIKRRVERDIIGGAMAEGDLVDSVRQVASTLQVNPLTVARAYQELADEGYLDKQRGIGMRVAPGARAKLLEQERKHFIEQEWPAIAQRMEMLGLEIPTIKQGCCGTSCLAYRRKGRGVCRWSTSGI